METNESLNKLTKPDLASFMLFALYKIKELPEYSALSELAYVLDKANFLKLCEYFGGLTITIPTVAQLEAIINAMMLYQYVDIENIPYEDAVSLLNYDVHNFQPIKNEYLKIKELLESYQINPRVLDNV